MGFHGFAWISLLLSRTVVLLSRRQQNHENPKNVYQNFHFSTLFFGFFMIFLKKIFNFFVQNFKIKFLHDEKILFVRIFF